MPDSVTVTVTVAAEVTSTRIVTAEAICPFCKLPTLFEYLNDKIVKRTPCEHYIGRARLDGNATGFTFGSR